MSAWAPFSLRLKVYVRRGRLDRQIGSGCPLDATPELALRARQLIHPRRRRRSARNLRDTVKHADRDGPLLYSAVVIEPGAVRAGREAILGLAERLDGPGRVSPRGMVCTHQLLTDGFSSPLFNPWSERTVAEAVWQVADALGAEDETIELDAFTG